MKIYRRTIFFSLLIISTAVFLAKVGLEENRPRRLPRLGQVPGFSLVDSRGNDFLSSRRLAGKVWIADLFYTSCSSPCGEMSRAMAELSRTFEGVKNVALLSITIFPDNDPPQTLENYKSRFRSGKQNWFLLTGDKGTIRQLACDSFRLIKPGGTVAYEPYLVLVDRDSYIRGYYDATKAGDVQRLFKDTARLARE